MARSRSYSSSFVALLLILCGCSSGEAGTPVAPPTGDPDPTPPLTGAAPSLLTSDHVGDVPKRDAAGAVVTDHGGNVLYALPSATLQKLGAGLLAPSQVNAPPPTPRVTAARQPELVGIGGMDVIVLIDILYGLGVDISDWVTGSSEQAEAKARFDELQAHLDEIDGQLQALGAQMQLEFDQTWAHTDLSTAQLAVFSSSSVLDTYFTGSSTNSLTYYARQASLAQACLNTPGHPAACIPEQQTAYLNTSLKGEAAAYAAQVLGTYQVGAAIGNIHSGIVPKGNIQILRALARYIATSAQSPSGADPSHQAMSAYLSLEGMFTQLLAYQFQGALMVGNAYNQQDLGKPPLADGRSAYGLNANQYLTGDFEHFLREECAEFLTQVDWLAVNFNDYRSAPAYAVDMAYNGWGLAPDPVFAAPLARSRFFCAQVLAPFNQNRAAGGNGVWPVDTTYADDLAGSDFGLHGVVVLPSGYASGQAITLQFLDATGAVAATAVATPGTTGLSRTVPGRFPSTTWADYDFQGNASMRFRRGKATASYGWTVYDFAVSSASMPPGSYTVKLMESGTDPFGGHGPWLHTDATLGLVTIRTYDPGNPATGTGGADPLHAVPFGSFALRWPWGFQPLHSSPVLNAADPYGIAWSPLSYTDKTFSNWPVYPGDATPVDHTEVSTPSTKSKSSSAGPMLMFWLGDDPDDTKAMLEVGLMYSGDNSLTGYFPYGGSKYMKSTSLHYQYLLSNYDDASVKIEADAEKTPTGKLPNITIDTQRHTFKTAKLPAGQYKFEPISGYASTYDGQWILTPQCSFSATLTWHAQIVYTNTLPVTDI